MALRLRNRGQNPAAIEVIERIPGDWRLLNVTSGGEKRDAGDLVTYLSMETTVRCSVIELTFAYSCGSLWEQTPDKALIQYNASASRAVIDSRARVLD